VGGKKGSATAAERSSQAMQALVGTGNQGLAETAALPGTDAAPW